MKEQHKPLRAYRTISFITLFLLLAAFLLLLLVGLSLTIIKPIYIMELTATSRGQPATSLFTRARFGVWGLCLTSVLDTNDRLCFGPRLGYNDVIPDQLISLIGISPSTIRTALQGLFVVLILHLVAAGTSLLSLFFSLFLASHAATIISLIFTIITSLLASVVFAVDLVIAITARDRIPDLTNNGFTVNTGNAVWMVLGAVIASWLAVIFLSARACYCCGVRRKYY
ncbi:hypothetical protein D9758_005901 [Tetrapyrgos nigripes]|uniref:Pali-domain-containing protein n=1 Tax=Tetrapyrgos nigripes TaxID=182062 RepID=A0A8H5LH93_9AGAR|nr:hypothetical protein D9758_005901 [Tetrapyrgos nigripes]